MTDSVGKVMTVLGAVEPDRLGFTLMHEHLYLDLRKNHLPDPGLTPTERAVWESEVNLSNLHLARRGFPLLDNYLLDDEDEAMAEASRFKALEGGTIVDVTSRGLGRDPEALKRASVATGLNIVMGSGWYQKVFHPDDMDSRSVETLADEIVHDVTVGVGDTGIKSGIIGEIGINGDPITDNEARSIRAAARASLLTGAAISFHSPQLKPEKQAVLDIVEDEGADLTRTILGHSCEMADDLPFMLELLERGIYIQFDTLGVVDTTERRGRDHLVATAIPQLIDAGYGDRILLSQDVCWKVHFTSYGGTGYTHIQETFLPYLSALGVTDEAQREITVENPKGALTLVSPK